MNIHEYQAKAILEKYGLPISEYFIISNLEELETFLLVHAWEEAVLKVQVHAGGRGKAGGIRLAKNPNEMRQAAKELLGMKVVTPQTGENGLIASQIMLDRPARIVKEFYLGIVIDRAKAQRILLASPMGGVDIEQVAQQNPDQLLKLALPLNGRLLSYHILRIVKFMGWSSSLAAQGEKIIRGLVRAFIDTDATLAEINPLVETKEGELLALDAKLSIDDNALFRQPEIKNFFDPTQISPKEALAQKYDLAYVALDGDIGCMVNGAGLAMATMDIIEYYGGRPANFLDVGGGATVDKVAEGFKIILQDGSVKAILINIFGGIMDCQTLASGIISAASTLHIQVPMIVRMEGTNVDSGKKLLKESGLPITIAKDLKDAAQKVIQAANHGNISK